MIEIPQANSPRSIALSLSISLSRSRPSLSSSQIVNLVEAGTMDTLKATLTFPNLNHNLNPNSLEG
eukprot:533870-Amorphochlora_amoeboformis.AAC.1